MPAHSSGLLRFEPWDRNLEEFIMPYTLVPFRRQRQFSLAFLAAAFIALAVLAPHAQAQTYNLLYNFPGGPKGLQPGNFVVTSNGSVLGEASYDDCSCSLLYNYTDGTETVLHRFSEPQGYQEEVPQGLLLSKSGDTLYGTTMYGGSRSDVCDPGLGCGIAFSYDLTTSRYKLMHEFKNGPKDGSGPVGTQVLDSTGDLYGLTFGGGTNGNGAFYELTAAGAEKVLYSFGNAPDGTHPGWGPIRYGGNYYGVTIVGGANTCFNGGCGTIFKITPLGKETVLYNFTGGSDGLNPWELIGDSKGNFYGLSKTQDNTTASVFEINSTGDFSIAYNGSYVSQIGYIIMGTDGNLYASSSGGDASCEPNGCGQILKLTPTGGGNGTVTVLHQFDSTDGSLLNPFEDLVFHGGIVYGTTNYGGSGGNGVIYKLKP
jgi:uncharacterized repeat protein (TIGR03803 family)